MPMTMNLYQRFVHHCLQSVPSFVLLASLEKSEISLVTSHSALYPLVFFLRKHSNSLLNLLADITAVDYPQKALRFEVVYNFWTLKYNTKLRLKVSVMETMALPSLQGLFLNANWLEREVFDMFGVFYYNHSRLRRILTDYGFVGYPLRKDFPVTGFYEVRFSENQQRVVYEPLELSCAFRFTA